MLQLESLFVSAQRRSKAELHDVHASSKHDHGEYGIGILVEKRVLEIVVIQRDEDGQRHQAQG